MAAPEPADRASRDDGGNDEDGPRRGPSHGYANDGRRQGTSGKHYMDAEEIDDNLDYGSVDDWKAKKCFCTVFCFCMSAWAFFEKKTFYIVYSFSINKSNFHNERRL